MKDYLMISDAAKEVNVESHVLRYWEEELKLPIKRNEQGHRYYTKEDVVRFKEIKRMKDKGLQLKAIRMVLSNDKLRVLDTRLDGAGECEGDGIREIGSRRRTEIAPKREELPAEPSISPEDKLKRLQWLLQQMIQQSLQENNKTLCKEIKENIEKELDYQFRVLEDREDERDRRRAERDEAYYKRLDELLRKSQEKKVLPKWKHPSSSKN